jgi:hypothetical protein
MGRVVCVVGLSPEGESGIRLARAATQGQPVRASCQLPRSGALEEASTSGTLNFLPGVVSVLAALTQGLISAIRGVPRPDNALAVSPMGRCRRCVCR